MEFLNAPAETSTPGHVALQHGKESAYRVSDAIGKIGALVIRFDLRKPVNCIESVPGMKTQQRLCQFDEISKAAFSEGLLSREVWLPIRIFDRVAHGVVNGIFLRIICGSTTVNSTIVFPGLRCGRGRCLLSRRLFGGRLLCRGLLSRWRLLLI